MYPAIPTEIAQNALQMVAYCVTLLGAFWGLMISGRA